MFALQGQVITLRQQNTSRQMDRLIIGGSLQQGRINRQGKEDQKGSDYDESGYCDRRGWTRRRGVHGANYRSGLTPDKRRRAI